MINLMLQNPGVPTLGLNNRSLAVVIETLHPYPPRARNKS